MVSPAMATGVGEYCDVFVDEEGEQEQIPLPVSAVEKSFVGYVQRFFGGIDHHFC